MKKSGKSNSKYRLKGLKDTRTKLGAVIGSSDSLIWSETMMELIFNPSGEFRLSPEDLVSQTTLLTSTLGKPLSSPWVPWYVFRSVQMLTREWGAENNGKLPHLFMPSKTATSVPDLQWKTCLWTELNLGSCVCTERPSLGQNTLVMMNYEYIVFNISLSLHWYYKVKI